MNTFLYESIELLIEQNGASVSFVNGGTVECLGEWTGWNVEMFESLSDAVRAYKEKA